MPNVPSPCTRICVFDAREDLCLGCLRSGDEIAAWQGLDDVARRAVLDRTEDRRLRLLERWRINPSSSRRTD